MAKFTSASTVLPVIIALRKPLFRYVNGEIAAAPLRKLGNVSSGVNEPEINFFVM